MIRHIVSKSWQVSEWDLDENHYVVFYESRHELSEISKSQVLPFSVMGKCFMRTKAVGSRLIIMVKTIEGSPKLSEIGPQRAKQ